MKRQLKSWVVYGLYGISFILLIGGVVLLGGATKKVAEDRYSYVSEGILDKEDNIKVVEQTDTIIRPYTEADVKVVKGYYDYLSDAESQESSLIYYEGTYMPSSGVAYSNGKQFDVVPVLSGTVTDIVEDTIIGNSITIEHNNGIISVYQSVSDIKISKGDVVAQGVPIAISSTSNISKELDNHLYFELIIDGVSVNPESYFDKASNEI